MNLAKFTISKSEIKSILDEYKYLDQKIGKDTFTKNIQNDGVSDKFLELCQKPDYVKSYLAGKENFDFDIMLFDESYFQFSFENCDCTVPRLRYAFFHNPQEFITYKDFVEANDFHLDDVGSELVTDYEQYLLELELNAGCLPIRYDLDPKEYKPLKHPCAHIHFGNNNDMRIPTDVIMTPLQFVVFVLRQLYIKHWDKFIFEKRTGENESSIIEDRLKEIIRIRNLCERLDNDYWKDHEKIELHMV